MTRKLRMGAVVVQDQVQRYCSWKFGIQAPQEFQKLLVAVSRKHGPMTRPSTTCSAANKVVALACASTDAFGQLRSRCVMT